MKKTLLILGFAFALTACGGGGGKTITADVEDQKTTEMSAEDLQVEEVEPADLPRGEEVLDLVFDLSPEDTGGPQCQPGEGCFLDPCESNDDCLSGWCVGHMGEDVCSIQCQTECPPGWSCEQVPGTAPDVVWLCISSHANLCLPCSTGADCKGAAGADDVCVDYGKEGSYCGGACLSDEECPWGFSCAETVTVSGISTLQCVADAGVCPCTKKSVELALFTPCEVENEFGVCGGKRVCTDSGLTECDAAAPAVEVCNGLDDDCDGDVDEPDEVAGDYINLCNDDNACTKDSCTGADGCAYELLSEGECVDGDACTVGDHCDEGQCVGLPVVCDDKNPCTDDFCDGLGGCKAEFNSAACDDGDPCTVADACSEGECAGYAVDCQCQEDSDCAALEDGNLCNGTLICSKEKFPWSCAVKADTVVVCPIPQDLTICEEVVCDPATGKCGTIPDHEGFACEDGDACTVGDHCVEGECVPGVAPNCNDGNPCTDDFCNPAEGCAHVNSTKECSDNDVCTVGDQCADGVCVPGTGTLSCDDGNPCTTDFCNPAEGCAHGNSNEKCSDGNECTSGDHCEGGKCVPTESIDCDDDNPCTADGCTPQGGCNHTIVAAPCDDGDPCTVNDKCVNGLCQAGPALDCDDGNPCTEDSCDPAGGCAHSNSNEECDDGNACTVDDHCEAGKCVASQSLKCNDDNVCTTDSCDPKQGCLHLLNSAPCNDDDLCTTGDHCHLGQCIGGGQLTCNDGNSCTDDSCNPAVGCVFSSSNKECDDGNVCTTDDKCADGWCKGGTPLDCDDDNLCTDDLCDVVQGCMHFNNSLPCNDANACTANEFCSMGSCGGGVPIVCNDSNPCTDDSCAPDAGCQYTNNILPCDDDDACTDGDICAGGECTSGPDLDCDDSNVCTDDSCDPDSGCIHTPVPDLTVCAEESHCEAGECVPDCGYVPGSKTFAMTKTIESWTVPDCIESITIEAWGAQGGKNVPCSQQGGKGARMKGTFVVTPGEALKVVVGERGKDRGSDPANQSGTGGGGSFVWRSQGDQLLLSAGGGGGGAICTSGGGAQYATGMDGVTANCGTKDSTNANAGGCDGANGTGGECYGKGWNAVKANPAGVGSGGDQGGFGGGGTIGSSHGGGGGGGYGGGGCKPYSGYPAAAGGGGGSYNGGSNTSGDKGVKTGHGEIIITW